MTRAAERQKREAAAEAARLLNDIERDELVTGGTGRGAQVPTAAEETVSGPGRRSFGGAAAARHTSAQDADDVDLARSGLACTSVSLPIVMPLQPLHMQCIHEQSNAAEGTRGDE